MAASISFLRHLLPILLAVASRFGPTATCYPAIFSFGDSLADTGNLLHSLDNTSAMAIGRLPYGQTYFHHPTGRFCDGRLVIDFIAQALGMPLLPPFLGGPGRHNFSQGVNFAVGGATALNSQFFVERGIKGVLTNYSLDVQLEWFNQILPSLCSSESECKHLLGRSVFFVGPIGGNDYNYPILQGMASHDIRELVPKVVNGITSAISELIGLGARTLVIPGSWPIGCSPILLTTFQSTRKDDYDPLTGCIKWPNEFTEYHNSQLQDELQCAQTLHPDSTIIYADIYEPARKIFLSPDKYGFDSNAVLLACCGGGGPYNFNKSAWCGSEGTKDCCSDPSKYASWDALHPTEAAYKRIAQGLLGDIPFLRSTIHAHPWS